MKVPFSKYSGCGNDFILIDNRKEIFSRDAALISRLCRRPHGIGADGVILLENSSRADFRMRIFNSDGGEAEMCGNGLRCLKPFLKELGVDRAAFNIETMERILKVEDAENGLVKAAMGDPLNLNLDLKLQIGQSELTAHYLNTGVPHAVCFVNKIDEAPVHDLGKKIRLHSFFAPKGANANFVEALGPSSIALRTYERGVEEETLACGTGAAAAAIVSALKLQLKTPIEVKTRSGESLFIDFRIDSAGAVLEVSQTGPASLHFHGNFPL